MFLFISNIHGTDTRTPSLSGFQDELHFKVVRVSGSVQGDCFPELGDVLVYKPVMWVGLQIIVTIDTSSRLP